MSDSPQPKKAKTDAKVVFRAEEAEVYDVHENVARGAHVSGMQAYETMYAESIDNADAFWRAAALKYVSWFQPFTAVQTGSFVEGDIAWFLNGKLNVSYNCLDRHLVTRADQIAIIWEGDEPTDVRHVTYREAHREVCRLANVLLDAGECARLRANT
jgi:acetyl-CoA synthetase